MKEHCLALKGQSFDDLVEGRIAKEKYQLGGLGRSEAKSNPLWEWWAWDFDAGLEFVAAGSN